MTSGVAKDVCPQEPALVDVQQPDGGLLDTARALLQQVLGLVHDQLQLAALETRLAGQSLVAIVAAGVMVALLVVSAWLGLMAAATAGLVGTGFPIGLAILMGVGVNLALTVLLFVFIRYKSRHLLWSASLRSLQPAATAQGDAGASP